jgi:hypothetical protein
MSVLHSRIITHAGTGAPARAAQGGYHPYGSQATPMVMPLATVTYEAGTGFYDELYPSQPATADPNHVPMATIANGQHGEVRPAGRP